MPLVTRGGDYSWDRPSPTCLFDAGWRFVVRYTSSDASKNMSRAEVDRLVAAGLQLVTVWQEGKAAPLGGATRGTSAARESVTVATAAGMPANRPHYFALDDDPRQYSSSQWVTIRAFYAAAAQVVGTDWVGVYGGYKAIETLCPSPCPWGWQTRSWSDGVWSAKAQLRQVVVDTSTSPVHLCNARVDYDEAWAVDYGQWIPGRNDELTDADKTWLRDVLSKTAWQV